MRRLARSARRRSAARSRRTRPADRDQDGDALDGKGKILTTPRSSWKERRSSQWAARTRGRDHLRFDRRSPCCRADRHALRIS